MDCIGQDGQQASGGALQIVRRQQAAQITGIGMGKKLGFSVVAHHIPKPQHPILDQQKVPAPHGSRAGLQRQLVSPYRGGR
ncbi:hypothetical protein D3C77_746450 [compost metagenome]